MATDTFLAGRKTLLRSMRKEDAQLFVSWMNNEKVRQYLLRSFPITEYAEEEWIRANSKMEQFPTKVIFVIEAVAEKKAIGVMGIHEIDWVHRNCVTGTTIGETDFHGKGYATDAKLVLLQYAFDTLGMHKVTSLAFEENAASIAYSKKCGYEIEAVLKEDKWRNGKWCNTVVLSCFRAQWQERWKLYMS